MGEWFQGREVFEKLTQLQARGVKLQLAVNAPQVSTQDTAALAATGTTDLTALWLSSYCGQPKSTLIPFTFF